MNAVKIDTYGFAVHPQTWAGTLVLTLEDGSKLSPRMQTLHDLAAMVDLLRNERPLYLDSDSGMICSTKEPVGEGEGAHPPPPPGNP